jgi:hypothetical protein
VKRECAQISNNQNNAAGLIVDLISSHLGADQGVHPETAIASSARLAGSLLLRSFKFELETHEPGQVLLSEEVNEKGPQLINILSSMLTNFDIALDKSKIGTEKGEDSKLSYLESMDIFQNEMLIILRNSQLDFEKGAQAAAMATAFIVKECSTNIGSEVGFNAATYGFIEGSKTIPPLFLPEAKSKKKPWYKIW